MAQENVVICLQGHPRAFGEQRLGFGPWNVDSPEWIVPVRRYRTILFLRSFFELCGPCTPPSLSLLSPVCVHISSLYSRVFISVCLSPETALEGS